jgi:chaperonin cofactor prefoldin
MAENKKSPQFLKKLATLTDEIQTQLTAKATLVLELKYNDFRRVLLEFEDVPDADVKEFKVDISGMDFIFLLDES